MVGNAATGFRRRDPELGGVNKAQGAKPPPAS
jgi:hypothetical protein